MAKIFELDPVGWAEWLAERPEGVRRLCERFQPDRLYLLKSSGHRVTIMSYSEDDTMRVYVSGQFNFVTFEREVFGIKPEDLEECDLPPKGEPLGTMLTEKADIDAFVDEVRPFVLERSVSDKAAVQK